MDCIAHRKMKNCTWPADPEPCDGLVGVPPPVLHDVAADQGAGSTEPGFAMNCNATC